MIRYLIFRLLDRRSGLFRFHDGRRWRAVDPFTVHRALLTHPTFNLDDLGAIQAEAENPKEKEFSVWRTAEDAVRDVFGIPPFSKGGLTSENCLLVLAEFQEYVTGQKKSGNPPPTSPPVTEPPPSAEESPEPLDSGFT